MTSTQEQTAVDYRSQARERHQYVNEQLQNLPEEELKKLGKVPEAAAHTFTANAVISVLGFGYTTLQVNATFESGERLTYNATGLGPIVGAGGISFGGGVSAESPAELIASGEMAFVLNCTPAGVFIEWGGIPPIATFIGGGLNVAGGWAAGSGSWSKAS